MKTFNYLKCVAIDILRAEISSSLIGNLLSSLEVCGQKITVNFSRDLSKKEEELLYKIVFNHNPKNSCTEVIVDRIKKAIAFGQSLLLEFTIENISLGLTTDQIKQILIRFSNIQALLNAGSLYTALEEVEKIEPTEYLTQERINKYVQKLKKYLELI